MDIKAQINLMMGAAAAGKPADYQTAFNQVLQSKAREAISQLRTGNYTNSQDP